MIYGFTITGTGETADISVIASSDSAFEREGARTLAQYRYEPLIFDGEALDTPNQTFRMIWYPDSGALPDHPACPKTNFIR